MPLLMIAGSLVEYVHVPRSGGTSVENYLIGRFGPLGFLDRGANSRPPQDRWTRTSPQHVDARARARLIPDHWIGSRFATVRHPETRLISVFMFQRDIEKTIAPDMTFETWIEAVVAAQSDDAFHLDNHARRAVDLVPGGASIFKMEDGLDAVIPWLDTLDGGARAGRTLPRLNGYEQRASAPSVTRGPKPEVTPVARVRLRDHYAADYERFGYAPEPPEPDAGGNAKTALEPTGNPGIPTPNATGAKT